TVLRAFVPFVPRPAVLPFEASPRPTRVFAVCAPGTGRRWCTLSTPGRDAAASCFFSAAGLAAAFLAGAFFSAAGLAAALAGAFLAGAFFSAAGLAAAFAGA